MNRTPQPPSHLGTESKKWFREIVNSYELEPPHVRQLELACNAMDRWRQAVDRIAEDGAYQTNRFGELRPHPALNVERDSRLACLRAIRELGIDCTNDDVRPPRIDERR